MAELTNEKKEEQDNAAKTTETTETQGGLNTMAAPQTQTQNKRGALGNTLGGNQTGLVGTNKATTANTSTNTQVEKTQEKTPEIQTKTEAPIPTKEMPKMGANEKATPETTQQNTQQNQAASQETVSQNQGKAPVALNTSSNTPATTFKQMLDTIRKPFPITMKTQMNSGYWDTICPATAAKDSAVKEQLTNLTGTLDQMEKSKKISERLSKLDELITLASNIQSGVQAVAANVSSSSQNAIASVALNSFSTTVANFISQCQDSKAGIQNSMGSFLSESRMQGKPEEVQNDPDFVQFLNNNPAVKEDLSFSSVSALNALNTGTAPMDIVHKYLIPQKKAASLISKDKTPKTSNLSMSSNALKTIWTAYKQASKDQNMNGLKRALEKALSNQYETGFVGGSTAEGNNSLHTALLDNDLL